MDASLWVAKTGLNAQQTRMTVIANNLANVNTVGFKRDRPVFEDLLYQNMYLEILYLMEKICLEFPPMLGLLMD